MLGLALAQLPAEDLDREILVRTDIGGQTHAFTADCREAGIRFSVGYELNDTVRAAILELPETAWVQAINAGGAERDGAWVCELTDHVDLSAWPDGSRLIVRRERPHPGAQFTIFDERGYRHTCFLTDQDDTDIAALELGHRGRARVEDSIRAGKDTGMRNLPHHAFEHNQTWLELADRPGPVDLDEADLPGRRTRDRRTQTPASPTAAHRRAARPPRPAHPTAPPSRLAVGTTARCCISATPRHPSTLLSDRRTTASDPSDQPAQRR